MLSVKDVSVSYDDKPVIEGINLDISKGQVFGLIGLNGVGKTTLIKTILGLRTPDTGEVIINQIPHTDPDSKKHLSYLPERFDPPWFLSGIEFLKFSNKLYKEPLEDEEAESLAESLALDPRFLKKRVQTYSKGMRQKLGLMSVLLSKCSLLILDEPMSGLDPMARTFVKDALQQAQKEGRTVFLSSHILPDMNDICDDVTVLHNARLIFNGSPSTLLKTGKDKNIERAFLNIITEDNKSYKPKDEERAA